MSTALHLDIAASGVHAWMQQDDSYPRRIARWLGRAANADSTVVQPSHGVAYTPGLDLTDAAVAACDEALRATRTASTNTSSLHVRLGFSFSRIALVNLGDAGSRQHLRDAGEAIGAAWLKTVLGMDPQGWLLRCEPCGPAGMLLSCVKADIVERLRGLADRHRLPLKSCRPAALDAMRLASPRGAAEAITLWQEEGADASPISQFFGSRQGQLVSVWRGRLPRFDDPMHPGLLRLKTASGISGNAAVNIVQWPRGTARGTAAA